MTNSLQINETVFEDPSGERNSVDTIDKKIRLVDAARAANTTVNSVKNWLARGQVDLFSDKPDEGWREFFLWDVQLLALVRILINYGMPPSSAGNAARAIISEYISTPIPDDLFPLSAKRLWLGRVVLIWRTKDNEWKVRDIISIEAIKEADLRSALIVDVSAVIDDIFERLREPSITKKGKQHMSLDVSLKHCPNSDCKSNDLQFRQSLDRWHVNCKTCNTWGPSVIIGERNDLGHHHNIMREAGDCWNKLPRD